MPTGYNIIWDIQYKNMLLRTKYDELKEKNDKLCEELAEKTTTPRYVVVAYTIFVIVWAMFIGMELQAMYWILPNV